MTGGGWKRVRWEVDSGMSGEAQLQVTVNSTRQAGIGVGLIADASVSRSARDATFALLITSDTHRADHISIVNDRSLVRTPHSTTSPAPAFSSGTASPRRT